MRISQATLTVLTSSALALASVAQTAAAQETEAQAKAQAQQAEAAQVRKEIDAMSEQALQKLLSSNDDIKAQFDEAVGYAVFRATKGGLVVTGAGGTGVAVDKQTGERTYMHMGSGGIGIGAGLQSYRPIFLFETEDALERFIDGSWDASTAAQAAAGKEGVNAASSFIDGVAVYQLTKKGLMAQADLSGTRFWESDKLNATGSGS